MPQMLQVLRERAIGMLTAGMSTRAVACELNVHFSTISCLYHKAFQRICQCIQPAHNRRPRVTTPTQDLHIQHLHLPDRLRPATRQLLQQSVCITKEFLHKLSENRLRKAIYHARRPHRGSTWLQFVVVTDLSGQYLTFDGFWHFGEVFFSTDESRFSLYMADGRQRVWRRVVSSLLMSMVWIKGPWWRWGYGMDMHMVGTTNTGHFIDAFECTEIPWRDLEAHCCAIHPRSSPHLQHYNARPMLQGSVHNSWKLKTSQFLHGQHTHRTCHPLSIFRMLWIGVYDSGMRHPWGGCIISAKEKCSLTQIYTDLWTIFEKNRPFVYIEKVLDLWVQLMKKGGKNKKCCL